MNPEDADAAALYAALEKTDDYKGSFTVVNTDSGSSSQSVQWFVIPKE